MLSVKALVSVALIGTVCALLLAGVQTITREPIAANRLARDHAVLQHLLGVPVPTELELTMPVTGDCADWLIVTTEADGYAGPVHAIGVWLPGPPRLSLRVTAHRETPGIGDFIDHAREDWMAQLDEAGPEAWQSVDNVSGATVTTRTVRRLARQSFQMTEAFCE